MTYAQAGAGQYVALQETDGIASLKGPPLSGLTWRGPTEAALELARPLPDNCGAKTFWRAFLA